MAIIEVKGLGKVEIAGETPTEEEVLGIREAINSLKNEADVEQGLATDTVIPEIIDPNLKELNKPKGLEKIGGRPTFEAAGAIGGSVLAGVTATPMSSVAGGTLGAMGGGQLYDVLQSAITDEPTDFGTQAGKAKKDFQREATLQSFFAKVPGLFTSIKRGIFGKADKPLYDSAKRIGFPLSLSDSGNMISRGYGNVIGIFPYVGTPILKTVGNKANLLNKTADDTLNTFAPNVGLTKLGIDMSEAAKSTYKDFRRVTNFFYKDFESAASKITAPIISTQNFKNSLINYTTIIDDGTIKLTTGKNLKTPQKDAIYKYAKSLTKGLPEYINISQYRSLVDQIKIFARKSQKEGYDLKVLTGLKSSLETDLNLLTKKSYLDTFKRVLTPSEMKEIATKLTFANKVYANGLENSIISNTIRKEASKKGIKLTDIPGIKSFDTPTAKKFKMIDKNIFGPGFQVQGSITADQLGNVMLANRNVTPQLLDDLRTLVGKKQYNNFVRSKLQQGYDKSLIPFSEGGKNGLMFDPYKFELNLGLTTQQGRDLVQSMLKDSKLTLQNLDDFFTVAKNHAGLKVPDVSSFVARRAALGGTKSVLGGLAMGYTGAKNPVRGIGLIYLARKTSGFLANPKQLDSVMKVLDPNSTASQMKISSLKLMDAMISDSQNNIEKNELSLYREFIEMLPTEEIKNTIEKNSINPSSENFLKKDSNIETPNLNELPQGDQSFLPDLPQQNLPETPSVDVAALQPSNTTMNQDYNSLSSLEKDRLLRGIS